MGALYLLPMSTEYEKRDAFAHEVLAVDLRTWPAGSDAEDTLADRVRALTSRPVPPGLWSHMGPSEHDEVRPHQDDAYGDQLRWVAAGDLASLAQHPQATVAPRNRATFAYVAALPARVRIFQGEHPQLNAVELDDSAAKEVISSLRRFLERVLR